MLKKFLSKKETVSLDHVRYDDVSCYVKEGFGGKPMEDWPIYTFFNLYHQGRAEEARDLFFHWYRDQLRKYHNVSNEKGGMYKGSLYRLIEAHSGKDFNTVTKKEKDVIIYERVDQRLAFFDVIAQEGYRVNRAEPIEAVRKNGFVYLKGGHHRAAALWVLGEKTLPSVFVFPSTFVYNAYCLLRKIKHGNI